MTPPKPMLARDYDAARSPAMRFPRMIQPKLDGVRMLAVVLQDGGAEYWSRNGKSLQSVGEGILGPRPFAEDGRRLAPGTVLDGELYAHGAGFQTIVSMVKQGGQAPPAPTLEYHVYDAFGIGPMVDGARRPFRERSSAVSEWASGVGKRVVAVPTVEASSADGVERAMDRWTADGYEGVMIRDPEAPYEPGKRSASLLKYKRFQDAEFEITGFTAAKGKDAGTVVFVCACGAALPGLAADARCEFRVRPTGTVEHRRQLLADAPRLVGKHLTVRYQGLTDGGVPRFPVGVAVRDEYEGGADKKKQVRVPRAVRPVPDPVPVRIATWNINGLAAAVRRGSIRELVARCGQPDVICLQEIRCAPEAADGLLAQAFDGLGYPHLLHNCSRARKGYSGTAVASRGWLGPPAQGAAAGDGDEEGRVLEAGFCGGELTVVCVYAPNSGVDGLRRLAYRVDEWEPAFSRYVASKNRKRNDGAMVVVCGDLNVAAGPLDVHSPEKHERSAGYTPDERACFERLCRRSGMVDVFRARYPDRVAYTYWSPMSPTARASDRGWRIDYFLVPAERLADVVEVRVHKDQLGSDHAPVTMDILRPRKTTGAGGGPTPLRWLGDTRTVLRAHQIYEIDKGAAYGAAAYARVADQLAPQDGRVLVGLGMSVVSADDLDGVGPKIRAAIASHGADFALPELDEAARVDALLEIPFVGARAALQLVRKHGIQSGPEQLTAPPYSALLSGPQAKGLMYLRDIRLPIPRAEMALHQARIGRALSAGRLSAQWELTGSYARGEPTSSDVDVVASPLESRTATAGACSLRDLVDAMLECGYVRAVLAQGGEKFMGLCRANDDLPHRRIDVQFAPSPSAYAFARLYMGAGRDENLRLRRLARAKGWVLNEHGLFFFVQGAGADVPRRPVPPPAGRTVWTEGLLRQALDPGPEKI